MFFVKLRELKRKNLLKETAKLLKMIFLELNAQHSDIAVSKRVENRSLAF